MESIFLKVAFSPPPSLFLNTLSVINLPSFAISGFSELRGQNLQYSKFWNNVGNNGIAAQKSNKEQAKVDSRAGMLICYTPAFLASVALLLLFPHEGNVRILLLNSALALHFLKRIFEVIYLFVIVFF